MAVATPVVQAGLRRSQHIGGVFNGSGLKQHLPVVLAGEGGESGWNHQQIGSSPHEVSIQLRKANVVTDGQTHLAQTRHIHHRRQLLAGIHGCRLAVGVAVGKVNVEEVDLVVAGQQLAIPVHQFGPVQRPRAITHRRRESSAQQHHLVAPRHRHQKATAAFGQVRRQLQAATVLAHEGEVLRQTHQIRTTSCRQIDLLLGGIEIDFRVLAARELHGSRQEVVHGIWRLSRTLEAFRSPAALPATVALERHSTGPGRHSSGSRRHGHRAGSAVARGWPYADRLRDHDATAATGP